MYRIVLQMVGKRYDLIDTERWEAEQPRSEIVMIGGLSENDPDELERAFDSCIGTGDESQSPVLRVARRIFAEQSEFSTHSRI